MRYYGHKEKIVLIRKGLFRREESLYFREGGAAACVTDNKKDASYRILATNIDAVAECNNATWIKMDIEGAELDALQGACETIKRNHPKLTICIYHSEADMLRIIEYIYDLVPEYKIYIRHHSRSEVETVLYAVCND